MSRRLTTSEFIERAKAVHGDKYDYSKVEYINSSTKVCIICPKHGEFWIAPLSFLNGVGCKKCAYEKNSKNRTKTTEQFIKEAKQVHGNKYTYSKVEYVNSHTKVCIICLEHGEFWQRPYSHLNGEKCPFCVHQSFKYSNESFIEKAREIHGDKYDYSKVEYIDNKTKVCIICPIHGEFWQTPANHLKGKGCQKCYGNEKLTTRKFIEKAKEIHGDRYDYSKVEYVNAYTKICIICPIHGEFWQRPADHLQGCGCEKCKESRLEKKSRIFLSNEKIDFLQQKRFDWLGRQSLDFYLPRYNVGIECQGKQHFQAIEHFGGKEKLEHMKQLDSRKKQLCEKHGVKLYYINYNDDVEIKLKEILQENGTDKVIQ